MPLGYNDFEEPGAPADSVVVGDTVVASHQLLVSDTLRREFASKGIRYLRRAFRLVDDRTGDRVQTWGRSPGLVPREGPDRAS
jgi:hypothetical protein